MKSQLKSRLFISAIDLLLALVFLVPLLAWPTAEPAQAQDVDVVVISPSCCGTGAVVGETFSITFTASGGDTPYRFEVSESIPGLAFHQVGSSQLRLSGVPTAAGTYPVSIRAYDEDDDASPIYSAEFVVAKATPVLTISQVISAHPNGTTFMEHYPVTVVVEFIGTTVVEPTQPITISGGADPEDPTCTALMDPDTRTVECDFIYEASGAYSVIASYPGDDNFLPASSATITLNVQPFVTPAMLSAGQFHTCYLRTNGDMSCWGNEDMYRLDIHNDPLVFGPVLKISAGGYHTCMIKLDNSLECWGDTSNIEIEPNHTGRIFTAVSSGGDFACALTTKGNLFCWGALPDGFPNNYPVSGPYIDLSAGSRHVCVLSRTNRRPTCWGSNSMGQSSPPNGLSNLKAISSGNEHTCAIKSDNSLVCWGNIASPPAGTQYTELGAGSNYSCARKSDNRLTCWGTGSPPVDTTLSVAGFSSGTFHTCGWLSHTPKNYLACWGNNTYDRAPQLSLTPTGFTGFSNYIPQNHTWSQTFTTLGGTLPHSLQLVEPVLPGMALVDKTVSWQPTTLSDENTFTLQLSENATDSKLPLELYPVTRAYRLYVQGPGTTATVSPSANSVNAGSPVSVTVRVNKDDVNADPPLSGTVTVSAADGTQQVSCQSAVSAAGVASCSLYFAVAEVKTIEASYSGNNFYDPIPLQPDGARPSATVTVNPISVSPLISAGYQFNCSLDRTGIPSCWGKSDAIQTTPSVSVFSGLSAGNGYACGRSLNGSIYCWGWDGYGLNRPPTDLLFQSVTAGSTHACGLSNDGTQVRCWGNNASNRLAIPAPDHYSQVSAGDHHTCALKTNGSVVCWGVSTNGQTSAPASGFRSISSGGTFTCGILTSGGLSCWGGTGIIDEIRSVPTGTFLSVDAGYSHACAIRDDDRVVCWGSNASNKASPPDRTFAMVSAGYDHTCGLRKQTVGMTVDAIECWGSNARGQTPTVSIEPASLATIDVGAAASLPITASGGRSGTFVYSIVSGALPAGLGIDSSTGLISGTPTRAGEFDFTVRALEGGRVLPYIAEKSYHLVVRAAVTVGIHSISPSERMAGKPVTFFIQVSENPDGGYSAVPTGNVTVSASDGKQCIATLSPDGSNSQGQCTIFFTTAEVKNLTVTYPGDSRFLPGAVTGSPQITVVPFNQPVQVQTSQTQTYLHLANGSFQCMGADCANDSLVGPLSTLDVTSALACGLNFNGLVTCRNGVSQSVNANGPFRGLAVGGLHACALRLDGSPFCWGANDYGQASPLGGTFTALSAGLTQTCGIRPTGELACWGTGATPPAGQFSSLQVGDYHACAVAKEGSLACWGDNSYGRAAPPAGTGYKQVSVGNDHSCALTIEGHIQCWGANSAGQANVPYGLYDSLEAAGDHACAVRSGPGLTCWGGNLSGEAPQIQVTPLNDTEMVVHQYWEFPFNPSGGNRPYTASVTEGSLPDGIDMQVTLSPAGVILYGTPSIPNLYDFVLKWIDAPSPARPVALVLEKPFSLLVTGADLSVDIGQSGAFALTGNTYWFDYALRNHSLIPVPSVGVRITLPENLEEVTFTGPAGCSIDGGQLDCVLASLGAGAVEHVVVSGKVPLRSGNMLETQATIQPLLETYPELVPADNTDQASVPIAHSGVIFDDPVEDPLNPAWDSGELVPAPGGQNYLGDFTSDASLNLIVTDLPPHKSIELSFDLYVIGPWLGNNDAAPDQPSLWSLAQTGTPPFFQTTFCNQVECRQAYPRSFPEGAYGAWQGSQGQNELGFVDTPDSRYRLRLRFEHSGELLDLTFRSHGLPEGARWGLDNVRVKVESGITLVYLPAVGKYE